MQTKSLARIGAVAFVAIAITATAIQLRDAPKARPEEPIAAPATAGVDLLNERLARCQAIGLAAASDEICLTAWKENRRRFLALDVDSGEVTSGGNAAEVGIGEAVQPVQAKPVTTAAARPASGER